MQVVRERKKSSLRLVKPIEAMIEKRSKSLIDSEKYYKQVEHYADQIRGACDTDEIIGILDAVLSETRGLEFSDEVCAAQEQVKLAERKIETMKNELKQLRTLVQIDQMTGAFNRRGLDEIFSREAARADRNAKSLCTVLIDIDDFKQINDSFGHQYGDHVLIKLVSVAKDMLRPSDIVARFGGEEFVILLPDIEMDEAIRVIHRLQKNLAENRSLLVNNESIPVTFSAGVAIRSFGEHQNSVINRADGALYQAKRDGKNQAVPAAL
ncbi:MAG: GGDEF domain-containing protein [Nitrosomonas sp.]|nr:GGDEF domain-containing protein [Nitrosomonas sp.]